MISRYSRERMNAVWSPENRYRTWLDIEILACEAMSRQGVIPKKSLQNIKKKAAFDIDR
ncbi:MAG: adenylosuccinate lyase, partial [Syntrophus sp. (in: bacteria)]|nr:adenylosuccinate lyase [Syntrophus sp. (in: bacteria)]